MNKKPEDFQPELEQLLAALVDGELDDYERRRLNELLRDRAEARGAYIGFMALHADLHARHAATLTDELHVRQPADDALKPSPASLGRLRSAWQRAQLFIARPTPLSLVVAALVLASLMGLLAIVTPPIYKAVRGVDDAPPREAPAPAAVIAGTHDAQWAAGQDEFETGAPVAPGQRLELSAGLVEIRYVTGEAVILEGPASFLVGRHRPTESFGWGDLKFGTLTADVPASAIGFTIDTPAARIVDLGTSFGVAVADGATEVHVLSGKVEAHLGKPGNPDAAVVVIERGQAYRVAADRTDAQRIAFSDDRFTRGLPVANRRIDPYAAAVLADRPIGYWPLSERSSTLAVNWAGRPHGAYRGDIARNGPPRPGDDAPPHSLQFDGQNDTIEILHDGRLNPQDFTLEAWVRLDRVPEDHGSIVTSRSDGRRSTGFMLYVTPQGTCDFWTGAAPTWDMLKGPAASAGEWTHIAATFQRIRTQADGALTGVKRLYVNGQMVAENANATYIPQDDFTLPLRIGSGATEQQRPKYYFPGQVADIAVYGYALTAEEIAAHVAAASPGESSATDGVEGHP